MYFINLELWYDKSEYNSAASLELFKFLSRLGFETDFCMDDPQQVFVKECDKSSLATYHNCIREIEKFFKENSAIKKIISQAHTTVIQHAHVIV